MQNFHVGLNHFLFISIILLALGLYAVSTRKNQAAILIGIEFIFSAAALNFAAFQKYTLLTSDGQAISIFIIILAVTQSIIAACIILNFYRQHKSINLK